MHKTIIFFFAVSVLALSACHKKNADVATPPAKGDIMQIGTLKDLTGLDGCGWIIQLDNGVKLNPSNLADFKITLKDGKRVSVDYQIQDGVMTTCMSGKSAKIILLQEFK